MLLLRSLAPPKEAIVASKRWQLVLRSTHERIYEAPTKKACMALAADANASRASYANNLMLVRPGETVGTLLD